MNVSKLFSKEDLAEIEAAVKAAERSTSGEIVPCAVGRSDEYPEAVWRAAALGAMAAALLAALLHEALGVWGGAIVLWLALPALVGGGVGYLFAALVPAVKRLLIPEDVLAQRVAARATSAFVEHEVFATAERTGILLFLSVFEHRVLVLGDAGINAKVEQHEWDEIVAAVAAGIRAGKPGRALAEAIGRCGDLLHRRGVELRPGDVDELPDRLRTSAE